MMMTTRKFSTAYNMTPISREKKGKLRSAFKRVPWKTKRCNAPGDDDTFLLHKSFWREREKKKTETIVVPANCPSTCAAFPRPLGPIVSSLLIRALIFFLKKRDATSYVHYDLKTWFIWAARLSFFTFVLCGRISRINASRHQVFIYDEDQNTTRNDTPSCR